MDTIYTISGGGWFRDSLNGVAAFMQSDDWSYLLAMATTLSVVATALAYIKGKDLMHMLKWAGAIVLVSGVLIGVKRPVQIIDLSQPTQVYQVDNVPVGITMPFSVITSIGHALVVGYETIFHQPDALSYSKTGMLFGADMMGKSTDFLSTNPEMTGLFSDYVQNCVVGDMMLNHKYTLNDLMTSQDPYAVIFSNPSPLRGVFDISGRFQTCQWAAAQLQDVMGRDTTDGGETWHYYVRQVFGGRPDATALYGQLMGDSYSFFYGASQNASEIMKQNVTMNALRKGIASYGARNGDSASLINLSSESSYSKLRVSQATAADIATRQLPIMQTVLTGILIGLFPIVIVLALISVLTLEVLKGYVFTIAYLQSWPLLFAILNNAMNYYLRDQTGNTPVTLSNLSLVQQQYSDIGSTAGWLALSIPFLAYGIVLGLGKAVSQAGSYLGSALQGSASQSSSQAVDGTWAFNNMQTDNVQGSKWDTNSSFASGQMTTQAGSGAMKTLTNDGNTVYNAQPAMSKLATDINFGKTASSTAQRLARESETQAESALQGYNHSVNSSYNMAKQYSQQAGNSATMTSGADSAQSSSESMAVNQMLSAAQSYAKRNNISESEAWSELQNKSSNLQGGFGGSGGVQLDSSKTLWGKPGELVTGVSGKGEIHAKLDKTWGKGDTDSTSNTNTGTNDNSRDQTSQEARDFRQGLDSLKSYRTNTAGSQADNASNSQLEQIGATLGEADSNYQQYTSSLNRSHEYSKMASASDTTSASVQGNYAQEFVGYVQQARPQDADRILTNTEDSGVREERESLANQFMEEKLRSRVEGDFASNQQNLGSGMSAVSSPVSANGSGAYQKGLSEIETRSNDAGIRQDSGERVQGLINENEGKVSQAGMDIHTGRGSINNDRAGLSKAHEMAGDKFDKGYYDAVENQKKDDPRLKEIEKRSESLRKSLGEE